ncbi:MAG: hypothetical protein J6R79_05005 [Bacteroidaceae bacterium]|nr:hypothetical protein [Bacteroidaceae bacterium]
MKTTLFAITLLALPLQAQNSITEVQERSIYDYFTASLENGKLNKLDETIISIDDISTHRTKIWRIWKDAVNNFEEEKLVPLKPLEERASSSWTLPEDLEPNAKMPFYWGCNDSEVAADTKYPLFLYMHGSGNKHQEWETGIGLCLRRFYNPAIYFVPQIPNIGEYYRWAIQSKQWAWEKLLRLAFLTDEVDANKIYFFGISEGGYGSQRLASFYADYLAGAGPMAGGEPLKNAPMENVGNIAFSLRTGALDESFGRNILTQKALDVADSLKREHPNYYNHYIEVIPDYGHAIDYKPTTPWLAKFERDPHPNFVYWENYDMYGRKREGFYNLRILKNGVSSSDAARECFKMTRDGNAITIKATKVTYTTTYTQGGIEMFFDKKHSGLSRGKIRIYLNEEEYDLSQPITLTLNGIEVFNGMVKPDLKTMVESCAFYYDPERVFPAAIDVDLGAKTAKPTSINSLSADETSKQTNEIYDLSGRKVNHPLQNSIYINQQGSLIRM